MLCYIKQGCEVVFILITLLRLQKELTLANGGINLKKHEFYSKRNFESLPFYSLLEVEVV